MQSFVAALAERVLGGQSPIVIGLDPRLDALPTSVAPGAEPAARITAFYRQALPAIARHAPAVKPNIAFFEQYGAAGYAAYETTCAEARRCGLLVVGDIKRGDIGSTAERYAKEAFERYGADAVTLSPFMGFDSVQPYLKHHAKGAFLLCRTSNPGGDDLQNQRLASVE